MDFIKDADQFLSHLELGKKSEYSKTYNPELLQSIPRNINRSKLNLSVGLPFSGFDIWTFYELSFLNSKGLPALEKYLYLANLQILLNPNLSNFI